MKRIPPETVLFASGLTEGAETTRSDLAVQVREAVRRVVALGYFSDVKIYGKERHAGVVDLTIVVLEKLVVKKINVLDCNEIDEEDIRKTLSVKEGRFLDAEQLVRSLRSIEELYQDKGYYLAEASYEVEKDEETRTAVVTIRVKEQLEVAVRSITFVGNREISDEEIKSIMVTREKGFLSFLEKGGLFLRYFFQLEREAPVEGLPPGLVDEVGAQQFESWSAQQDVDLQRVKWFYLTRGYVEVKLGQPRLTLTPDKTGIDITIDLEEGRWYKVGRVDVVTDDPDGLLYDPAELKKALTLKKGTRFNAEHVMQDTDLLTRRFKNRGYAFVSVSNTHHLDRENGILDLTYIVEKGRPTYISTIEVSGNKTTADKVIRRELRIAEGDLYNQELIDRSKALIYRLGFFESVEITHEPTAPAEGVRELRKGEDVEFIDLRVNVKERDTGVFQVGAGFSSLESYIFQARISKNNFLGRGQTLSFQALLSSLRSIYMISFLEPYFFDTNWSFSFDLYNTATDFEAFTTDTLGGNVSWGYKFFDDYFLYLTYKVEQLETKLGGRLGFTGVPIEMLESKGMTTSLRFSIAWDTRNNRIIPTEGFYHSASLEWASPMLGGETDFYRSTLNSRYYVPLVWNLVLRLNGTLGYITTEKAGGIPIFERYFVGGIFSVRGFQRNSLSPTIPAAAERDPASSLVPFPMGGNKELIFNAEIEVPIFRQMGIVGVVFFDAGNAFAESEALSLAGLRTSAGFGVRWWSPMGPLRFEWGFPLAPRPGEDPMVFEFTVGSAF